MTGLSQNFRIAGLGAVLASCAILAGCADTTDEAAPANRNHFVVTVSDGNLVGVYDPANFSQQVVRQVLDRGCVDGTVATYSETPTEGGLTEFTATCGPGGIIQEIPATQTYQRASTRPATTEEVAAADAAIASPTGTATTGGTMATTVQPSM
ncbi:hypothetical protein [Paracoccus ravus]|uniref:hypothetical protein n=1 Tax=Paracoccus ravus TaxID=2447760 RepID=UPI00106EBA5C|nr:hypothetical protein [Paracoccus ravus]